MNLNVNITQCFIRRLCLILIVLDIYDLHIAIVGPQIGTVRNERNTYKHMHVTHVIGMLLRQSNVSINF